MEQETWHGILVLLLCSCSHEEFDVNNLNGGKILALGHAGMGIHSTYPIDSPASILSCLASAADGSEIDIQLTKDSVLIAFHHADLSEGTNMSGLVWDHTWNEISEARMDGVPYSDHRIVALDDLLEHTDLAGRTLSLDIKLNPGTTPDASYYATYVNAIDRLFRAHPICDRCFIESQSAGFLVMIRQVRPELRSFFYPGTFEEGFSVAREFGFHGISIDVDKVNPEQIARAHAENLWIALWDVKNNEDNRRAIRLNPEMIQSDEIDGLVDLLQ